MNISIQLKSILAKVFNLSGIINYKIRKCSKRKYLILMYHRIIPCEEAGPGVQAGMYVEPDTFEMHIRYLKNRFYIIPLSDIFDNLQDLKTMNSNLPICIITFDDGWYDFFKYAYPILEKHNVPATVFLPTEFIGTQDMFWTDEVASIISMEHKLSERLSNKGTLSNHKIEMFMNLKGSIESQIEEVISKLKNYHYVDVRNILEEIKITLGVNKLPRERLFLKWEEVRLMAASGLINFGSHSANHRILVHIDGKEIVEELLSSKKKLLLEGVVKRSFIPFCYPNGSYDEKVIQIVRESGYHVAVTTENGWNNVNTPMFNLHRVAIHQDVSFIEEMFGCRISNIF